MAPHFADEGVVIAVLVTLATGAVSQPAVVIVMTRWRVIDTPNERSSHTVPTPRGGGLAVVIAAIAGLVMLPHPTWPMLLPMIGYAALGLADDVGGISVKVRLVVQSLIGLAAGVVLTAHAQLPTTAAVAVAAALSMWMAGYVNAFNFMDGANGIAAAHAVVGGLAFTAVGIMRELPVLIGAGATVAAAALTFLPWNAGRARIFLGDVGSYGLGGALGSLAAYAVLHGVAVEAALFPLALFLADTGWTLLRRIRAGQPWHRAHRWHAYQRLTDAGFSHSQVAFGTAAVAAALSTCGLLSLDGGVAARVAADLLGALALILYLSAPRTLAGRPEANHAMTSLGVNDAEGRVS